MRTHPRLIAGMVLLGIMGLAVAGTSTGPSTERYVTFAFDDGYASHTYAAAELEQRGWRGVFYVPAGLLNGTFEGLPTMTRADVQGLDAAGHEVGGHTYTHANLSTLTLADARTTLDRNHAALTRMGVEPYSFAYPYGVVAHVNAVAGHYPVARAGWGVNTAPPDDVMRVRTISLTEDNAGILDDYLARLEPGEWLVITLHHVDRDGGLDRPDVDVSAGTYEHILETVENADVAVTTMEGAPWNG